MKNEKRYENVDAYYESLSRPCKKAFVIGIKYALKIMRASTNSKNELEKMLKFVA